MESNAKYKLDKIFKVTLLGCVTIFAIYFAGTIILPIIFALFASFGLSRMAKYFEKKGLGRNLSALIPTLVFTVIFFGLLFFVVYQSYYLINEITSKTDTTTMEVIDNSIDKLNNQVNKFTEGKVKGVDNFWDEIISSSNNVIGQLFSTTSSTLSFFSLVPIYIFFMLSNRHVLVDFLKNKYSGKQRKNNILLIKELSTVVKDYLKGMSIVILIITTLNCIGLYALGIKYALALGILSGVLTIVPYIGVIIGAILPVTVAYFTGESNLTIGLILGIYMLVQFIEGNLITPKIMGSTLSLNPLAILLGVIMMGAFGGILAIVLTVPLIAAAKVALEHSTNNKAYAKLLGGS